jgi:hypothetical protein
MINLNQKPAEVFNLKEGDHVLLNGIECVMYCQELTNEIFFSTADSRLAEYQALWAHGEGHSTRYTDYVRHARIGRPAVNSRAEFHQALLNDQVVIDPPFIGI